MQMNWNGICGVYTQSRRITQLQKSMHVTQLARGGWPCKLFYRVNSERERQVLKPNSCIWLLKRQYWQSYTKGIKKDSDVKNRHNPMMVSLEALLSILGLVIYSEVVLTLDSQP